MKTPKRERGKLIMKSVSLLLFIFLCVKIGWACTDFKDFQLDNSWAYLIGIALGSKALQTIGESGLPNKFKSNTSPDKSTFPNNFSALGRNSNNEIPLHDSTTIDTPPPTTPPPHIKINN